MKKKEIMGLLITALCKNMFADAEIIYLKKKLDIAMGRIRYGSIHGLSEELCKTTLEDIDEIKR